MVLGGAKQPGRTPTLVVSLPGRLPLRLAARAWRGLLFHATPRSSWVSRPQPGPYGEGKGFAWARNKNRGDCGATTNSQQPGQNQQPKGKGPKGSRTKKGTWGEETAGANAVVGVDAGRAVAEPEGGAAFERNAEP